MPARQDASPLDLFALGAPSFTTFTVRDGLPDPVTVTLQTDRDGFVWVGTQHGLARYDGKRWHAIDDPALDGYVDQLFVDHDGTLWASSRTFGLARYDGRHWHLTGAADGVRRVRRLVESHWNGARRLWAVTWDAGLFYRQDGHWHPDPGNGELPRGPMFALAHTHGLFGQDRQWVGTSRGLWYRTPGRHWRRFDAYGFDPDSVESMLVTGHDGHQALWISVFGEGLWRLDADGARNWSKESGDLTTDQLYNIVQTPTPDGGHAIWVASRDGLVRIYHDRARVFDRRYGLPSNAVRGVRAWRSPNGEEVLWLATESGVARTIVGGSTWNTVSLMGSREFGVFGVLVDRDGQGNQRLWVGSTGDGLGVYTQGHWRYFTKAGGQLPDDDVNMIVRADDRQGKPAVWIGTRYGDLLRTRDGTHLERITTPWPHTSGQRLNDMLERRRDGIVEQWFATRRSGIYRLRGGTWKAYGAKGVVGAWEVEKLVAQTTPDGHDWLWATSSQGLARFDGTRWVLLGSDAGLPGVNLIGMSLLPDAHGHPILWLGSVHHGIIRVDVRDPMHPKVLPSDLPTPPDPTAYDALRDSQGRIYICTNAGVQLLVPTASGYRAQVFTRRDGMVNDECNTNAQFIDAHDRFWTGTLGGLTVHDPRSLKPDRYAKPLRLTQVALDGKPVSGGSVRVPPGHHDLRVVFALLSWRNESQSRFRTYLEGFDAGPGAWTADNVRDIGALPAGSYTLHIEAHDYAGNRSVPIVLPIKVMPHWWQRIWAWALYGLAVLLAMFGLLRWRMRNLQQRQHALEHKIAERTAELNDANQQLRELSHRDALTGLFNRRRLLESLRSGIGDERSASLIFIDVDHFKDFNDTHGHLAGDQALSTVAHTIRERAPGDAIVARYGGEEFACLVYDCHPLEARAIAERIRLGVEACEVPGPGGSVQRVTISVGVACLRLDSVADSHTLIHAADSALYRAKRSGRNCVRE